MRKLRVGLVFVAVAAVAVAVTAAYSAAGGSKQSPGDAIAAMMDDVNAALATQGADYRVGMAEYITSGDGVANIVFSKEVGNKQLAFDFVPFDPLSSPQPGSGTTATTIITQISNRHIGHPP